MGVRAVLSACAWLCVAAGLTPAWAQAAAASESRIAQVTLYPGSATVERVAKLAAGAKKFSFTCLLSSLSGLCQGCSLRSVVDLGNTGSKPTRDFQDGSILQSRN